MVSINAKTTFIEKEKIEVIKTLTSFLSLKEQKFADMLRMQLFDFCSKIGKKIETHFCKSNIGRESQSA